MAVSVSRILIHMLSTFDATDKDLFITLKVDTVSWYVLPVQSDPL